MEEKILLTAEELCNRLKISRSTLNRLRVQDLPEIQVGKQVRFSEEDVSTWLQKHGQGAQKGN